MRSKISIFSGLLAILLICGWPRSTHADEDYFLSVLYGRWRDPRTGDNYWFERNQTYVFRAGAQKSRNGNLSHGGTWSVYDPKPLDSPTTHLPLEATPYGLRLTATHRQVLNHAKVRNRPAHRVFKLIYQRMVLNFPRGVSAYFSLKGRYYYYREPDNPRNVHRLAPSSANNPDRVFIGQTLFVRMK